MKNRGLDTYSRIRQYGYTAHIARRDLIGRAEYWQIVYLGQVKIAIQVIIDTRSNQLRVRGIPPVILNWNGRTADLDIKIIFTGVAFQIVVFNGNGYSTSNHDGAALVTGQRIVADRSRTHLQTDTRVIGDQVVFNRAGTGGHAGHIPDQAVVTCAHTCPSVQTRATAIFDRVPGDNGGTADRNTIADSIVVHICRAAGRKTAGDAVTQDLKGIPNTDISTADSVPFDRSARAAHTQVRCCIAFCYTTPK